MLTHRARGCRGDAKPPAFFNANFSDNSDNSDDSDNAQTMERGEGRGNGFPHRSAVALVVPQHTKKCGSIFTRCRSLTCPGYGAGSPMYFQ